MSKVSTQAGWWRPTNVSTSYYRCLIGSFCTGGLDTERQCLGARTGPLCAVCAQGYVDSSDGKCRPCGNESEAGSRVFFALLGLAAIAALLFYLISRNNQELLDLQPEYMSALLNVDKHLDAHEISFGLDRSPGTRPSSDNKGGPQVEVTSEPVGQAPRSPDFMAFARRRATTVQQSVWQINPVKRDQRIVVTQQMKIVISYFQISTTLAFNLDIPWPTRFKEFLSIFEFANIDPIQFSQESGCLSAVTFYTRYILMMVLPLILIAGLTLFYLIPKLLITRGGGWKFSEHNARPLTPRHRVLNRYIKMALFCLILLYPRVSSSCLQLYACQEIEGRSFLVADFNLECYTSEWTAYALANIILLLLWPVGIPVLFYWLLKQTRKDLQYLQPVVRYRLGAIYAPYAENVWYFELLDLLHKLVLTGLVRFFPQPAQLPVGMVVAMTYFIAILVASPYVHAGNFQLHLFAQIDLFLMMLAGSVFLAEAPDDPADALMSACLLIAALAFLGIFVYRLVERIKNLDFWKTLAKKYKARFGPKLEAKPQTDAESLAAELHGNKIARERSATTATKHAMSDVKDAPKSPVAAEGATRSPTSSAKGSLLPKEGDSS